MVPAFIVTWLDCVAARFGYCVFCSGIAGLPWWHPQRYLRGHVSFVRMAPGEKRHKALKPYRGGELHSAD